MFRTRLLSGILLIVIALAVLITGGPLLFGVLLLISLIGMSELYKVFGIARKAPGIVGYIFAVLYYAILYFEPQLPGEKVTWFMMFFMGYLICQMAVLVFSYPKYNTQQIFAAFFGVLYVAAPASISISRTICAALFLSPQSLAQAILFLMSSICAVSDSMPLCRSSQSLFRLS